MDYKLYREKVYGCWLGKTIAGNMGGPLEDCRMLMDFRSPEEFSPERMSANDDLDLQLVWLDVLLEKGRYFTSQDLMDAFRRCYPFYPNEYGYGIRNDRRGIHPPESGIYANDFFKHSMGCPIRAEIWGLISPLNPRQAAAYAYKDGCLDHGAESIYAEQYIAVVEALAFGQRELAGLLAEGLRYIPQDSRVAEVVRNSIDLRSRGIPWRTAAEQMHRSYGHNDSSTVFYNMAVILLALLYGNGDFDRTVTLAVNGGYDTDCTAATVGAVLGVRYGGGIIDGKWKEMVGDTIKTMCRNIKHDMGTIDKLTDITCRMGYTLAAGKIKWNCAEGVERYTFETPTALEFQVRYEQGPGIIWGGSKRIELEIWNRTVRDQSLRPVFSAPADMAVRYRREPFAIPAGTSALLSCDVKHNGAVGLIRECNVIKLDCLETETGNVAGSYTFGVAGRPVWRVQGPYPAGRNKNMVSLEEAYLHEDMTEFEYYWRDGKPVWQQEDELSIDQVWPGSGPCCMYAFQKFAADEEETVEFHVGSTSPYRIWLNGTLIFNQPESNGYSPYTDVYGALLREGENRLAVKMLRCYSGHRWTMVMRKAPFGLRGEIRTGLVCYTDQLEGIGGK